MIDLAQLSKIDTQRVSKKQLANIIEARVHEIFVLVKDEFRRVGLDGMLPAGVIMTGSAAKMSGMVNAARDTLNLPVQIGFPIGISGVIDKIDDPGFATATGLVLWGVRHEPVRYSLHLPNFSKVISGLGNFFRKLLP